MIIDVRSGGVYSTGGTRVLVLSDEVRRSPQFPAGTVLAAPIFRRPPGVYGVQLADTDPVAGWVHLGAANQVPLDVLDGDALFVTGATLERLVDAFKTMVHGK